MGQHGVISRQRISNDIFFTVLLFDDIRERLSEFNPFSMSTIQFFLTSNVLLGLTIIIYNKFFVP
jgi:hypothetical protein